MPSPRVRVACLLAAAAVLALAPAAGAGKKATVEIANDSRWDIHHLFVSPADETRWGPDQLGDHVIASGASFTLTDIACDTYDIKVVDEDGDECVIADVDLCKDDSVWKITNDELLDCERYGR